MRTKITISQFGKILCVFIALLASLQTFGQTNLNAPSHPHKISANKSAFLHGANYVGSKNWLLNLEIWDEATYEDDMKALSNLGVNCLRVFPPWSLVQPEPDKLDETILKRLDRVIQLAGKYHISIQLSPLTGFVSGKFFMPGWTAHKNVFTDPELIKGEQFLARELAKRYRDNPNVQGFDFGNELNMLKRDLGIDATDRQIDDWMQAIYTAFKEGGDLPVSNGIGTGYPKPWNVENMQKSVDVMSAHYYTHFSTSDLMDPYIGLRTTYGCNCFLAWAAMSGKPVLMQEIGDPTGPTPDEKIGKFLKVTFMSSWADGAIGYLWWNSHNIDLNLKLKSKTLSPNRGDRLPYTESIMGLLDEHNQERGYAGEFKSCATLIDQLGAGWKNTLPVCYIVAQKGADQKATFPLYINPYVLAKQVHMNVKFVMEGMPVPDDAASVVVPGFELTEEGKGNIGKYLTNGGVVYQSFYNDFANNIHPENSATSCIAPVFMTSEVDGNTFCGQHVQLSGEVKIRNVKTDEKVATIMAFPKNEADRYSRWDFGRNGVFFRTKVGKGTYYYLAADIEQALTKTYDPWDNNDADIIYSVLRPKTDINIDSKNVELFCLVKGSEKLLLLINHVDKFEDVIIRSANSLKLRNVETGERIGEGRTIAFRLNPGQVLVNALR